MLRDDELRSILFKFSFPSIREGEWPLYLQPLDGALLVNLFTTKTAHLTSLIPGPAAESVSVTITVPEACASQRP
jgi:hypothetical protein